MALITASELAGHIGADATESARLLALSTEIITRYVNNTATPETIKNEAIIRLSGWLNDSPANSVTQSEIGADVKTRYNVSHNSALRHSGAMSLLSPYKRRRASQIKSE